MRRIKIIGGVIWSCDQMVKQNVGWVGYGYGLDIQKNALPNKGQRETVEQINNPKK